MAGKLAEKFGRARQRERERETETISQVE